VRWRRHCGCAPASRLALTGKNTKAAGGAILVAQGGQFPLSFDSSHGPHASTATDVDSEVERHELLQPHGDPGLKYCALRVLNCRFCEVLNCSGFELSVLEVLNCSGFELSVLEVLNCSGFELSVLEVLNCSGFELSVSLPLNFAVAIDTPPPESALP
jgi:hypothetical protein